MPGKTIDTLYAWLQQNELLDFYDSLRNLGIKETRDLKRLDSSQLGNVTFINKMIYYNYNKKIQFEHCHRSLRKKFDFKQAFSSELPCQLQVLFPDTKPLVIDGKKKVVRIVSKDSPYKSSADLVLHHEGLSNVDIQIETRLDVAPKNEAEKISMKTFGNCSPIGCVIKQLIALHYEELPSTVYMRLKQDETFQLNAGSLIMMGDL